MAKGGSNPLVEVEFEGDEESHGMANSLLTLVGRFLTNRPVRAHIMKERMAGVWRPGKGVSIREAGQGAFLFQFFHPLDLQKVLKQGPWFFDKNLLMLSVIPEGVAPTDVPLFQIPFWVQVHNVPTGFMSETIGKHVGNTIGTFLEYDPKNSFEFWRLYTRIRVLLDVRRPLLKSLKLKKKGGEAKEVVLKYERLDVFCYLCGMLGHVQGDCQRQFEMSVDDGVREWGPELKAEVRRGGSSGSERWLREESKPWVAPNCVVNAEANQGVPFPNVVGRNNEASMSGLQKRNAITDCYDVTKLAEVFKNPALLFSKPVQQPVESPAGHTTNSSSNKEMMVLDAEVDVDPKTKRMREDDGGESGMENDKNINMVGASGGRGVVVHGGIPKNNSGSFLWAGPGSGSCQDQ